MYVVKPPALGLQRAPENSELAPSVLVLYVVAHDLISLILVFNLRCGGAVYEAEKVTVKEDVYHKKCLTCTKCSRALDTLGLSVAPDGNAYCKVCHKTVTAYERPQTSDQTQIQAEDEKEGCPRCGGK